MAYTDESAQTGELSGRSWGQYEIDRLLGEGGMASVYLARQTSIGRTVALKVMPTHTMRDKNFLQRFEREVKVIAELQNPRVLPVYDYGQFEGRPYIVMAYIPGGTLAERIDQGPMPLDEAVRLVGQIAEGLDHAHHKGVIHRDFKPANVLLDERGNVLLADFGIARLSESTSQLTGSGVVGTPSYIAPEAFTGGEITPSVDIYALGVTLYEMLTGTTPFRGDSPMRLITAHLYDPIPDVRAVRPELPVGVTNVIRRALAKDPAARYPSAGALAASLADAASGKSITPPPTGDVPMTTLYMGADGKPIRRKPTPKAAWFGIGTGLLIALTLGGMAALGMFNSASPQVTLTANTSESADSALPFPHAADGEVLVIVTDFAQEGVSADTRIYQALVGLVDEKNLDGVRVERLEGVKPLIKTEAVDVGTQYGATMVIWGLADSAGLEPHYEVIRNEEAILGQAELGYGVSDPTTYSAYISEDMSSEFQFLMLYLLGQIAVYDDQPEEAAGLLGEAVSIDLGERGVELGLFNAYILRCKALRQLGRYEEAIAEATNALALETDHLLQTGAYGERFKVYADMGNDEAAISDYLKTFEYASSAEVNSRGAWRVWRLGEPKAALVLINYLVEGSPTRYTWPILVGWQQVLYAELGDAEGAEAAAQAVVPKLNALVESKPNDPLSHYARGYSLALMNMNLDQALADLNQAIELAGGDTQYLSHYYDARGYVYFSLGDYDAAMMDLDDAHELSESNSRNFYYRAVIFDAQGDEQAALAEYLRFIDVMIWATEQDFPQLVHACKRIKALGGTIPTPEAGGLNVDCRGAW